MGNALFLPNWTKVLPAIAAALVLLAGLNTPAFARHRHAAKAPAHRGVVRMPASPTDPDKDAAFLDSISPLRDADKIVDPLFVYAGANDPRVPRSESDLIVKAMRARSVLVEDMVAGNEGH